MTRVLWLSVCLTEAMRSRVDGLRSEHDLLQEELKVWSNYAATPGETVSQHVGSVNGTPAKSDDSQLPQTSADTSNLECPPAKIGEAPPFDPAVDIQNLISMTTQAYGGGARLYDKEWGSELNTDIYTSYSRKDYNYNLRGERGDWTLEARYPEVGGRMQPGVHWLLYINRRLRQIVVSIRGTDFLPPEQIQRATKMSVVGEADRNPAVATVSDICALMIQKQGASGIDTSPMVAASWAEDNNTIRIESAGKKTFSEMGCTAESAAYYPEVVNEASKQIKSFSDNGECETPFHLIVAGHSLGGQTADLAALAFAGVEEPGFKACVSRISAYSFASPTSEIRARETHLKCNAVAVQSIMFASSMDPVVHDLIESSGASVARSSTWVCPLEFPKAEKSCSCSTDIGGKLPANGECFGATHLASNFIKYFADAFAQAKTRCLKPGQGPQQMCQAKDAPSTPTGTTTMLSTGTTVAATQTASTSQPNAASARLGMSAFYGSLLISLIVLCGLK